MKCKDCECCHDVVLSKWSPINGRWVTKTVQQCWGVKEPFEIEDINVECTEYPDRRDKSVPSSDLLMIGFDYSQEDIAHMTVARGNGKSNGVLQTIYSIYGEDAIDMYKKLTGINL